MNRLGENQMFCKEITVGTHMTEYYWSDRHPYEVVKVIDQNHVFVRELDHKAIGEPMSNQWELIRNESNPVKELKKRYGSWCWVQNFDKKVIENSPVIAKNIADEVNTKGKATRYFKTNVSFGVAEYYFDYEF